MVITIHHSHPQATLGISRSSRNPLGISGSIQPCDNVLSLSLPSPLLSSTDPTNSTPLCSISVARFVFVSISIPILIPLRVQILPPSPTDSLPPGDLDNHHSPSCLGQVRTFFRLPPPSFYCGNTDMWFFCRSGFKKNVNRATTQVMMKAGLLPPSLPPLPPTPHFLRRIVFGNLLYRFAAECDCL